MTTDENIYKMVAELCMPKFDDVWPPFCNFLYFENQIENYLIMLSRNHLFSECFVGFSFDS